MEGVCIEGARALGIGRIFWEGGRDAWVVSVCRGSVAVGVWR